MKKEMKSKTLYKFLRTGMKSNSGDHTWVLNKWYEVKGELDICNNGFHASQTPSQAFSYVEGEIVAQVEVRGKSVIQEDKECWSEMRLIKAWRWEKEDSVALAIFAAEQVIDIFEKKYPKDDRPRKAIESAKAYLEVVKLGKPAAYAAAAARAAADAAYAAYAAAAARAAADAAYAAYAADAARAAARAAAYAADAAYAAYAADAARAAAYAADAADAARAAARAAAYAAARKKLIAKIEKWFIEHIKTLTEIV